MLQIQNRQQYNFLRGKQKMTGRITVKKGYWNCVINYKEFGKYRQKWINTHLAEKGNKKLAQAILSDEIEKFQAIFESRFEQSAKNNVFFMEWIWSYIAKKQFEVSKVTYIGYKGTARTMREYFGNKLKLKDVTYEHLQKYFKYLKEERHNKNATIKYQSVLIYPALKHAYKNGYIAKNPVDFLPPIRAEKTKYNFYNRQNLQALFEAIKGHRAELAIKIAAYYGFRRSELIGLKWESVDFANKTITIENKLLVVNKEIISTNVLKTASSNRVLPLLREIEKDLIIHQKQIEKSKKSLGDEYGTQFLEYVLVDEKGELIRPSYVSQALRDIIKKHNLKKIRFHDLRHSCASLLMANKVGIKQIQEWLGHANFKTTADIYSHLDFDSKLESANKLSKAFGFCKSTKENKSKTELLEEIKMLRQELNEKEKSLEQKIIA